MASEQSRTVLVLSTFPFVRPRYGGPVRLREIVRNFKQRGWKVRSIAIYNELDRLKNPIGPHDIPLSKDSPYYEYKGVRHPYLSDLYSGRFAVADDGAWPEILKHLPERVDAIHVEHPWLWRLARRIQSLPPYNRAVLVYGSANIEYSLKRDILDNAGVSYPQEIIHDIMELEMEAAKEADLATAVTEADARQLQDFGASAVVLALNGICPWNARPASLRKWRKRLPSSPWLLYVASAHLPNITGFMNCIGPALACIPPGSRLVIAGSVCLHLEKEYASYPGKGLYRDRLVMLGELSDKDLAAVKTLAHGFILPITEGGGSNLKTAEALYSRSYVVGTVKSFRGYEQFTNDFGIMSAETPERFQQCIRQVCTMPPRQSHTRETAGETDREILTWRSCLEDYFEKLDNLCHDRGE